MKDTEREVRKAIAAVQLALAYEPRADVRVLCDQAEQKLYLALAALIK